MRILLDLVPMRKSGGGSRHLDGFLRALERYDPTNEYIVCLDQNFPFDLRTANSNTVRVPSRPTLARIVLWNEFELPKLARIQNVDVIVAMLVYGTSRPSVPQIVLERIPYYYCDYFMSRLSVTQRLNARVRRWVAYRTMRVSSAILAQTHAMVKEMHRVHPHIPSERYHVLPHAFERTNYQEDIPLPAPIEAKIHSSCDRDKILYVSHLEPHKGHLILIEAFAQLIRRGVEASLFLTIERDDWPDGFECITSRIAELNLTQFVTNLGRVSEKLVGSLYKSCDVFVFPSLCETFGWPLVEAQSFGIPVVAADTPVNREIGGEAAIFYAPLDAIEAAEKLERLLRNPDDQKTLSEKAITWTQQARIDWQEYVDRFGRIVRAVLDA